MHGISWFSKALEILIFPISGLHRDKFVCLLLIKVDPWGTA